MKPSAPTCTADDLAQEPRATRIDAFDSGVGGLSVLRQIHRRLPAVSIRYIGDVAHAPYGERSPGAVLARAERIVGHLVEQGAGLVVVACNTATVLAIETLRARWPATVFVGVEPGVKPGVAASRTRRIAVMATRATVRSARFRRLVELHATGVHVHVQACPGLVDVIETGVQDGPALLAVLAPYCDAIRDAKVDTVVLACTHYAFVGEAIRRLLGPGITLIDTASAVADRVVGQWPGLIQRGSPLLRVQSTGASTALGAMLRQCPGFEAVEIERLAL